MNRTLLDIDERPPTGIKPMAWRAVITKPREGGKWLGRLERIMFFCAFLIDQPLLIGGWLAFKVASKWEVWNNIVKVPDNIEKVNQIDFLRARRQWGSGLYQGFLIGTCANIIAGLIGSTISRFIFNMMRF